MAIDGAARQRCCAYPYRSAMSEQSMPLGAFSVSLAVKDLAASRAFYEKLGFEAVFGEPDQGWQILRNGTTTIGIFAGMFERNIITFNPGWDAENQPPMCASCRHGSSPPASHSSRRPMRTRQAQLLS
jgi:glyoxalase/bleomycin resistance protein/dioxygenase superfamily protein